MSPVLLQRYEINADMGEGFGRWKLVCMQLYQDRLTLD